MKNGFTTMQEAHGLAKNGDKVCDIYGNFYVKGGTDCTLPVSIVVARNWRIIPAEPKVLTADEWLQGDDFNYVASFKDAFNAGNQNGQIKEWNRLKPLVDAVRLVLSNYSAKHAPCFYDLEEATKNLQPPWEIN